MDDCVSVLTEKISHDTVTLMRHEKQTNSDNNEWIIKTSPLLNEQTIMPNIEEYLSSCKEKTMNFSTWHPDLDETVLIEEIVVTENVQYPKLNIPIFTKCQNCEMNFPTKYLYQRHQCNFINETISIEQNEVLLNDIETKTDNIENYERQVCNDNFFIKSELDLNGNNDDNFNKKNITCTFCGRKFISQNRLKIHTENNCKKAENVAKFYKSDLTVWKCKKCYEIFASKEVANNHVLNCDELITNDKENNNYNNNNYLIFSEKNDLIEKLSTELLLQCEFCNKTFADKNFLVIHQRNHNTMKNYECINCNSIFNSYCDASLHWLKQCSKSNLFYLPKHFYCEFCDHTFKSLQILYNHKHKTNHYTPKIHQIINNEASIKYEINISKSYQNRNEVNKLIQSLLETLDVPMETELSTVNSTNNNNDVVATKTNIYDIIVKEEEPEEIDKNLMDCHEQPQNKKLKLLSTHQKPRKNKRQFRNILEPGYKFQCERCIEVFDTVEDMFNHSKNEHAIIYQCEECGKVELTSKALTNHSKSHNHLKLHNCEICGRGYSQTSHLWQHMRFHQGIKPFACPHEGCNARYTIRPDLKDHIRKVHTRERPFKCQVCNKKFLTGSVFYQHRLIHTNDRRYGCEICQKRFFRADALNNHRRIHTNEKPFQCSVCGRQFRQKGDKNKHVRTQHPNYQTLLG